MIKKFRVDNFKSLNGLSITLQPMTVIVGNNATGKSSILQAIDFVCGSVNDDFSVLLERRGWRVDNIKSKFARASVAKILFEMELSLNGRKPTEIRWTMILQPNVAKNQLHLVSEEIVDLKTNESILKYKTTSGGELRGNDGNYIHIMSNLVFACSCIKIVKNLREIDDRISELISFLENSASFEMLAPENMRLSSRGVVKSIGESGRNLPSFIKQMTAQQKQSFMTKLHKILNDRIGDVGASVKGKPGWTQINVKEHFGSEDIEFSSREMSDGILRVLAFIAISEIEPADSIFLLDEIENGINSDYAEALLNVLKNMYDESGHQLVVTTHSTVFLDYVAPEQIVFLFRDETGKTRAVNLFENKQLKEKLEYMYPGEVLLNVSQREIVDILLKDNVK